MTPELIGILAVGATVIGLMLTFRREARADSQALRAEVRADNQRLRSESRADLQTFREEVRADFAQVCADFAQVRGDLGDLRKDVQSLTERTSRLEGLFAGRDRRNDAA